MLFEIELISDNATLTYVYPNCYSSTTLTVVRNLTVLSRTTDKINRISNHFWDRCRHEDVVNLRETQQTSKLNLNSPKINVNDTVLVYDEKVPRNFWRITIVTEVLRSGDSEIRGAIVRIAKTNTILKCPINKLFTVENTYHDTNQRHKTREQKLWPEATVIGELKRNYEC